MPTTLVNQNLGGAGTPQEVRDLRKSSYDLHDELGFPVLFKHRWNKDDADAGRTWQCPYHDELYAGQDTQWDAVCFGTGYVGGYADAQIVYVTIQDASTDVIKILPSGVLSMDTHPNITAPWLPLMGDSDLIIIADFQPGTWDVADLHERYVLGDVTPITMRGPGWGRQKASVPSRFRISQQATADRLPAGHALYQVPLVFDYSNVPPDVTPPWEPVPDPTRLYTEHTVAVTVTGDPSDEPVEPGTRTYDTRTVKITGESGTPGVVVIV